MHCWHARTRHLVTMNVISQPNPVFAFPLVCPYHAAVIVIVSQLSRYAPVRMLLNGSHVWELDGTAEVIKLQLQAGRFLCGFTAPWKKTKTA